MKNCPRLVAALARRAPDLRLDDEPSDWELAFRLLATYGVDGSYVTCNGQRLDERSEVFVVAHALAKDEVERDHADFLARLAGRPSPNDRGDAIDDTPSDRDLGAARRALMWRTDLSDAAREELVQKSARETAWRRNFAARSAKPAAAIRADGGASYRARQDDLQTKTREARRAHGLAPLPNRVAADAEAKRRKS